MGVRASISNLIEVKDTVAVTVTVEVEVPPENAAATLANLLAAVGVEATA